MAQNCWSRVLLLWSLLTAAAVMGIEALSPTGLNLPRLDVPAPHFGGAWAAAGSGVFTNLFKHATPFECQSRGRGSTGPWGWGPGEAIWPLRADGYPSELKVLNSRTEYCAMARVGEGQAHYPAGQYVLLYSGSGRVTVSGDASVTTEAPGRLVLQITPNNGFQVRIVATTVGNPLTNISIVPEAAEQTFLQKPYQPDFLKLVQGFQVLRFVWWQRIWGDQNNQAMQRTLAARSTPSSQTYQMKDGVSIEDMVALCNEVDADPWFSLPVAADDNDAYAVNMATYVARNLAPGRSVYIEFGQGGPGWGSTILATHTLRLARIWRTAFTANAASASRIIVVATYEEPKWIPYFATTFGAGAAQVDAIATSGVYGPRAWNTGRPCYYKFNDWRFTHDSSNGVANMTMDRLKSVVRSSVIHADLVHNHWHQRLKATGKRLLGVTGGPDARLQAPWWSARDNYQNIMRCSSWPCSRSLFDPAVPKSVTYASAAVRDAAAPALKAQAQLEWDLDELLMQLKLRDGATKEHMMDHLARWNAMGGDVMVVNLPEALCCTCGSGTAVMPPLECQAGKGISRTVTPEANPIYQAVRAFQAGENGSLPLAKEWSALETSTCEPSCKYGTCVKDQCSCWVGYTGSDCSTKTTRANQCNQLVGVNLEGVRDWSSSWTFVDIMRSARGFLSQTMDDGGGWGNFSGVALTSDGWVARLESNQKAGTMMIRDLQGHIPAGTYTMLYDGEGIIDCTMDVVVMRQLDAGRAEIDLKPSTNGNNGLYCTVERTNPANPVRNIRVLMPGFDAKRAAANPFHPRFVRTLLDFGVLRFMAWQEANVEQLPNTWDERPKPTARSYAGFNNKGGVAVEHMVQLANMVGAAPWFSMPHLADDEYHRSFATYVRDNLRPDVKVYVEWCNEVWHTGFAGGKFAEREGIRLGMKQGPTSKDMNDATEARLCYYSERTKTMSIIWKEVFGANADRVVIVAQGQAVWPVTSERVLTCRNATQHIDALAVGPYFGRYDPKRDTDLATYMSSTLISQIEADMPKNVIPHAQIAAKYGKPLLTYEAGPAIVASSGEFPVQAHRSPAMYGALTTYLGRLVGSGVQLITHFQHMGRYGASGSWGLLEWNDQDVKTSPKWQAIQDFIAANASTCPAGDDPSTGTDAGSGNTTSPGSGASCVDDEGCSDSGVCLDGACSCNTGYSGPTCNVSNPTEVYNCGYLCTFGQGTCAKTTLQGTTQTYGCTCNQGFSGVACSLFSCPNNCNYNGACLDLNVCACYPGFKGDACDIDCGCNGRGMCGNDDTCICDVGYKLGSNGCEPACSGCAGGAGCIAPGECGCEPACKQGTCYNGRCECWAGYTGVACDTLEPAAAPNYKSPMGVEVGGLAYWSSQWVFLDIMKQASAWMTQNAPDTTIDPTWKTWDTQDPLELRADGYPAVLPPGKIAHKLAVRNVQLKAMPGRYVALFDGEGSLDFGFDAKVSSIAKGLVEFDYTPTANMACHATGAAYCGDNGIWIKLTATNPANPIRNIRVVPVEFEHVHERQVFHPWFLKALERFKVLRFMAWMDTNNDNHVGWDQRTRPFHAGQAHGKGGVALDHIVDLCNRLGADAWITVHHRADDAYVRSLASYLLDNLRGDVKIHVEHSNEVWNNAFAQGKYARQKGVELGLSADSTTAAYMYHGKRSEEIFDIFTAVFKEKFGAADRAARLRYVVSTWGFVCSGWWGIGCGSIATNVTLSYGEVARKADALAIPGYFDCGLGSNPAVEAQMSVDAMLAQCASAERINATRSNLLLFKTMAAKFGLPLTTYEGGPSIMEGSVIFNGGGTAGAADKYIALQRDPRFKGIYESYLAMFDEVGLVSETAPFMQFVSAGLPSKYGSWGLIEYTGQPAATAPKYLAVKGLLDAKQPPGVYPGCLGPQKGAAGLGDTTFFGAPAVTFPRKSSVLIQGVDYKLTWPASHAPVNDVSVMLFADTDCAANGAPATPIAMLGTARPTTAGFEASVLFKVPTSVQGTGFFLRVEDSLTGHRNYSEFFAVQPLPTVLQPLPYVRPAPRCSPEYKWNISAMPTASGICEVLSTGCRYYRTSTKPGAWTSVGKPVYDCTAQLSPYPTPEALAAAGVQPSNP